MNTKEKQALKIIENMSSIFKMDDSNKKEIYLKILDLSEDDFLNLVKSLVEYNKKQQKIIGSIKNIIDLWKNNLEEIVEKNKNENEGNNLLKSI